jgi:hypothetical protein
VRECAIAQGGHQNCIWNGTSETIKCRPRGIPFHCSDARESEAWNSESCESQDLCFWSSSAYSNNGECRSVEPVSFCYLSQNSKVCIRSIEDGKNCGWNESASEIKCRPVGEELGCSDLLSPKAWDSTECDEDLSCIWNQAGYFNSGECEAIVPQEQCRLALNSKVCSQSNEIGKGCVWTSSGCVVQTENDDNNNNDNNNDNNDNNNNNNDNNNNNNENNNKSKEDGKNEQSFSFYLFYFL